MLLRKHSGLVFLCLVLIKKRPEDEFLLREWSLEALKAARRYMIHSELSKMLGIEPLILTITHILPLTNPSSSYIYCDLDPQKPFHNGSIG